MSGGTAQHRASIGIYRRDDDSYLGRQTARQMNGVGASDGVRKRIFCNIMRIKGLSDGASLHPALSAKSEVRLVRVDCALE